MRQSRAGQEAVDEGVFFMHTYAYDNAYRLEAIMRTTLNIESELLEEASKLTGVREKTALVRLGLEALIALESGRRLAKLGGTEKKLVVTPRRRVGRA
jgi:Arc/MetJ family transcription regulator